MSLTHDNKKLAFLFLTRGDLYQTDLWEGFFPVENENLYNIYSHPKHPDKISKDSLLAEKTISDRIKNTKWGDISLVKATFRLLRHAYRDDEENKKFILLSESCIPIRNFKYIYQDLNTTQTPQSYIWSYNLKTRPNHKAIGRRYKKFTGKKMISKKRYRNQSQWMILDREHVKIILDHHLKFIKYFKNVNIPDEVYFINLLLVKLNGQQFRTQIVNQRKTYKIWDTEKGGSHPITFSEITPEQITEIHQLPNENYYFLRKVSPETKLCDEIKKITAYSGISCDEEKMETVGALSK